MNEENEFYKEYTDDPTACNDYEAYDNGDDHNIYGTAGLAAGYAATRKTGTFHRPPDKRKPRILVNPSYTRYPESEESKVGTCIKYGCGIIFLLALIVLLFSC